MFRLMQTAVKKSVRTQPTQRVARRNFGSDANVTYEGAEAVVRQYLPKDEQLLYTARQLIMSKSYVVDKAISKVPDKYRNLSDEKGTIIIPFYSREKDLMMLQGRAVTTVQHNKRYVTIKIWDDALKIYVLDQINYNENI